MKTPHDEWPTSVKLCLLPCAIWHWLFGDSRWMVTCMVAILLAVSAAACYVIKRDNAVLLQEQERMNIPHK